jgi:hypothetical protein
MDGSKQLRLLAEGPPAVTSDARSRIVALVRAAHDRPSRP